MGFLPLLLICLPVFLIPVTAYSCKSLDGRDVDWFYAYKLPAISSSSKGQGSLSKGTDFLYADSQRNSWILSQAAIDDRSSAIGATVAQLFSAKRNKEEFYALYNDEHPNNKTDGNRGHMKGVLLFNDFHGYWLVHSVPNFPSTQSDSYFYPDSGKRNGQSFLCVTFPTTSLDDLGKQLLFGQPSVYEAQLPASFERLYPNLALAVNRKGLPRKAQGFSSIKDIDSVGGTRFKSFSKHKKYAKDLYEDLVAPELQSSLFVETWLNGPGDLPSECKSQFRVYNLRSVRPSTYSFKSSKDHSKWAVSTEPANPWICIGDINRQKSQKGRGGGTLCLQDAKISALYRLAKNDIEDCSDSGGNGPDENGVAPSPTRRTSGNKEKEGKPKGIFGRAHQMIKDIFGRG